MTRRRRSQPQPQSPPSKPGVKVLLLLQQLPEIARTSDEQRLTVLLDQVEQEYPEFYQTVNELIDQSPAQAFASLTSRWPMLNLILIGQATPALSLIEMIQTTIKKRRDANAEKTV